jgi:carbon storage regulator
MTPDFVRITREFIAAVSHGGLKMLVLTRKAGERIVIDDSIVVEVLEVQGNRVRIGIQAPQGVTILRQELLTGKDPKAGEAPRPYNRLASIS